MRCQQDQASGHNQPSQYVRLLRTRGERPGCRRSAKRLDELAP